MYKIVTAFLIFAILSLSAVSASENVLATQKKLNALGFNAGTSSSQALVNDENNHIVLGDDNITNAFIKVDWTVNSDARDKMNFSECPHGLSFVNDLETYKYVHRKSRTDATPHGDYKYGFKAQEILALEGDDPVVIDNKDENKLKLKDSQLIPILVKAIQELSAEIEILKAK